MSDDTKVEESPTGHTPPVTEPEPPTHVEPPKEPEHEPEHKSTTDSRLDSLTEIVMGLKETVETLAHPGDIPGVPDKPIDESPAQLPWTHKGGKH